MSGWLGDLGSMRGYRGREERRTQEWIAEGVKHWDNCKLRTALEWVVFTSNRTARLELTKARCCKELEVISIWA